VVEAVLECKAQATRLIERRAMLTTYPCFERAADNPQIVNFGEIGSSVP
jgi:hypothetical protein